MGMPQHKYRGQKTNGWSGPLLTCGRSEHQAWPQASVFPSCWSWPLDFSQERKNASWIYFVILLMFSIIICVIIQALNDSCPLLEIAWSPPLPSYKAGFYCTSVCAHTHSYSSAHASFPRAFEKIGLCCLKWNSKIVEDWQPVLKGSTLAIPEQLCPLPTVWLS